MQTIETPVIWNAIALILTSLQYDTQAHVVASSSAAADLPINEAFKFYMLQKYVRRSSLAHGWWIVFKGFNLRCFHIIAPHYWPFARGIHPRAVGIFWEPRSFSPHLRPLLLTLQWGDCVSNHQPHDCLLKAADQRKHQSSASLAFVRGIHRRPVNSPHKGPVTRKTFPFDDVIMKEVNPRLAKRPLKTNGRLANLKITSLVGQRGHRRIHNSGNIFCINGPLWGECNSHRWIPLKGPILRKVFLCHTLVTFPSPRL